jgi:hypothetical protein
MRNSLVLVTLGLGLVAGCVPISKKDSDVEDVDAVGTDGVVWVEKGIEHEDVQIDLGYQIEIEEGVRWIEPVAVITRDEASVANAMVFNSLASPGGSNVIAEEVATVYGPSPDADTAWYAQGKLRLPDGASQCVVHFRIVMPGSTQAWTREMTIQLE